MLGKSLGQLDLTLELKIDAWDKLKVLKEHPELADASGYELKSLYTEADPVYWFLLLMKQPQFAPPHDWWFDLHCRTDLPWARLLAVQPQFEEHCHWNSVGRGELVKLASNPYKSSSCIGQYHGYPFTGDFLTTVPQRRQTLIFICNFSSA